MRKKLSSFAFIFSLFLCINISFALPCAFFGEAKLDGSSTSGTYVKAYYINGTFISQAIEPTAGFGHYSIAVNAPDQYIILKIKGININQGNQICENGEPKYLNISATTQTTTTIYSTTTTTSGSSGSGSSGNGGSSSGGSATTTIKPTTTTLPGGSGSGATTTTVPTNPVNNTTENTGTEEFVNSITGLLFGTLGNSFTTIIIIIIILVILYFIWKMMKQKEKGQKTGYNYKKAKRK